MDDAVKRTGFAKSTIYGHENPREKMEPGGLKPGVAEKYANAYRANASFILLGTGEPFWNDNRLPSAEMLASANKKAKYSEVAITRAAADPAPDEVPPDDFGPTWQLSPRSRLVDSFDPDGPDDVPIFDDGPPEIPDIPGMVQIHEVDVNAGAGGGGVTPYERRNDGSYIPRDNHSATVLFPEQWLRDLCLDPNFTDLVRIRGISMLGVVDDGSWAFVDRRVRTPSPPDIFLLWDGVGVICKYLSVVINSTPPKVRVSSSNADFPTEEHYLDELNIIGRVAALITRPGKVSVS